MSEGSPDVVELACPRCSTTVKVAAGTPPLCPSCGYEAGPGEGPEGSQSPGTGTASASARAGLRLAGASLASTVTVLAVGAVLLASATALGALLGMVSEDPDSSLSETYRSFPHVPTEAGSCLDPACQPAESLPAPGREPAWRYLANGVAFLSVLALGWGLAVFGIGAGIVAAGETREALADAGSTPDPSVVPKALALAGLALGLALAPWAGPLAHEGAAAVASTLLGFLASGEGAVGLATLGALAAGSALSGAVFHPATLAVALPTLAGLAGIGFPGLATWLPGVTAGPASVFVGTLLGGLLVPLGAVWEAEV